MLLNANFEAFLVLVAPRQVFSLTLQKKKKKTRRRNQRSKIEILILLSESQIGEIIKDGTARKQNC